jgi:hypothetical protein
MQNKEEEEEEEEGLMPSYKEHIGALKEDEKWMINDALKEDEEWMKELTDNIVKEEQTSNHRIPHENIQCNNGSLDMRLKQNKGKQKYPYELQVIGNSHINYISHPNCKKCKGSICGRCVKHGG